MSVFLLEDRALPFKVTSKDCGTIFQAQNKTIDFSGHLNLVLQAEKLPATDNERLICGKRFPWKVHLSASPNKVERNNGFNLHVGIAYCGIHSKSYLTYGDERSEILISIDGDFDAILQHVFPNIMATEDSTLPTREYAYALNVSLAFDVEQRAYCSGVLVHVFASGSVQMGDKFEAAVKINADVVGCILRAANSQGEIAIRVTIELCRILNKKKIVTRDVERTQSMTKKLLEEKVLSDFVLVAKNDFEISCHKSFLQISSPVFERMFLSDCKEMKDNRCKLNLSEEGLKALLDFLYCSDIEKVSRDSVLAVELLEISHELQIPELETKMKEVLDGMEEPDIDLDGALQLFLRCTKLDLDGYDGVKEKAMNVIKRKKSELKTSALFKELMESNSKFGMEFVSFFI